MIAGPALDVHDLRADAERRQRIFEHAPSGCESSTSAPAADRTGRGRAAGSCARPGSLGTTAGGSYSPTTGAASSSRRPRRLPRSSSSSSSNSSSSSSNSSSSSSIRVIRRAPTAGRSSKTTARRRRNRRQRASLRAAGRCSALAQGSRRRIRVPAPRPSAAVTRAVPRRSPFATAMHAARSSFLTETFVIHTMTTSAASASTIAAPIVPKSVRKSWRRAPCRRFRRACLGGVDDQEICERRGAERRDHARNVDLEEDDRSEDGDDQQRKRAMRPDRTARTVTPAVAAPIQPECWGDASAIPDRTAMPNAAIPAIS